VLTYPFFVCDSIAAIEMQLHTLSVSKIMHFNYNTLLPHRFDDYFILVSPIHSYSTRLSTSSNLFCLELIILQENVSLHLLAQKCGLQYQTVIFGHFYLQIQTWKTLLTWKKYINTYFSNITHIKNKLLWISLIWII